VAHGHIADHVVDDVVQIGARAERVQVFFVLLLGVGHVEAVQIGIVEEAALDAPHFVVHLLPFGKRIDVDFHVGSA
jgi:hypothetical protein